MGEAKRRKEAMLKSEKWFYFTSGDQDSCYGKLTTIAKVIAERLSLKEVTNIDYMGLISDDLIEKLNQNNVLAWTELKNIIYDFIVNTCLKEKKFVFNEVCWSDGTDEGMLIDCESIEYRPDLDTRYSHFWDDEDD